MDDKKRLTDIALGLAIFTILFNIAEGLASVIFGYSDESLTLFGFGVDSFIEVVSALGILQMIVRIRNNRSENKEKSEAMALKITGYSFYMLSAILAIGIIINLLQKHKPVATGWGIIISIISIVVMGLLAYSKIKTGKKINSMPLISDGKCSLVCMYMSLVLLASSFLYETTKFAYADIIGTAGIIYFSISEGREALESI